MPFSGEFSSRQSVTKSSKVYLQQYIPTGVVPATLQPASVTDDNMLDAVSQEKSVHTDTAVLTLQQSSSGGFGGGSAGRRGGGRCASEVGGFR